MPSYDYKAIDKTGRPARGGLEAVNEVDLELRLRRMGLDLITYKQTDRNATSFAAAGKISRQDLINFCFDMEQMVRSGIPIIDGLRDMRDTLESQRFREVLSVMTEDMEGGKVLSQCMSGHPDVFDAVFVSLIRAGEQSGQLPEVFKNLADNLKWLDEIISQTRRLLILPLITLVVVLAVLVALLVFLVPQIAQLFKTMGFALPLQTKILLAASEFTTQFWPVVFGVPVVAAVAVVWRSGAASGSPTCGTTRSCGCRWSVRPCSRSSCRALPTSSRCCTDRGSPCSMPSRRARTW